MKKNEVRGVYNVTFNNKKATPIKLNSDIDIVEKAIIDEVVMYVKGYHLKRRDVGFGAKHIKLHLEKESEGYITLDELLNLGKSLREYLETFNEPFIDKNSKYPNSNIYEWQNESGVKFRCVIDKEERAQPPRSSSFKSIITFYSDRNLSKKMIFKNPKVSEYYDDKKIDYSAVEDIKNEIKNKDYEHLGQFKTKKRGQ